MTGLSMKNIFLTSLLRQPAKLVILTLLMCAAAFVTTLRIAEYIVVHTEIERIEGHFRSIGFLWPFGDDEAPPIIREALGVAPVGDDWSTPPAPAVIDFQDYRWQDLISKDPRVNIFDRRTAYNGELVDIKNAQLLGMDASFILSLEEVGLNTGPPAFNTLVMLSATFLGESRVISALDGSGFLILSLTIEEVFAGHEEFARPSQLLSLVISSDDPRALQESGIGMEEGSTYLIRGIFELTMYNIVSGRPMSGTMPTLGSPPVLIMLPLLSRANADLWDVIRDMGGVVDFLDVTDEGFSKVIEAFRRYIHDIEVSIRNVSLIATRDGSAIHEAQGMGRLRLLQGRWTNYQDYINAHPVAVISWDFASRRGLEIGDFIRVAPGIRTFGTQLDEILALTLEVVGIYSFVNPNRNFIMMPPTHHVYAPASLLLDPDWVESPIPAITLMDTHFSFVLNSPRDQASFIDDHAQTLLFSMGYHLAFIPTNFDAFASAADPIIQAMMLNLVVFSASGSIVLLLSAFIYIRMSRKEFVIQRALGVPSGMALRRLLYPILIFWMPVIIIGAVAAWFLAISLAEGNLSPVYDLEPHLAREGSGLDFVNLIWIAGGIGTEAIIITLIGAFKLSRQPILRALQKMNK